MFTEKQKEISRKIIEQLIKDKKIIKPKPNISPFFLNKSISSLEVSKRLLEISNDKEDPIYDYMWVINAAYYSMFFAATSLLAHFNHKIDEDQGIHKLTFHALVYYFIVLDNKLEKHFIEEYKEVYEEAEQLLQTSKEKADQFVRSLDFERDKRSRFTYEIGKVAEQNKAENSVKRANEFLFEVRKMIDE